MNKQEKDEKERINYNTFLSLAQEHKNKTLTSKEISEILKDHGIPSSVMYVGNMIQSGLFIKEGNNKYKFFDGKISFDDYERPISKSRDQHKDSKKRVKERQVVIGDKTMVSISEDEKLGLYVKYLKDRGYKIQKPIKVPVTIYETRYVDC